MRQPQLRSWSSGSCSTSAKMPVDARSAAGVPSWWKLPARPRLPFGAFSSASSDPPPYSPPMPIPWTSRSRMSSTAPSEPATA